MGQNLLGTQAGRTIDREGEDFGDFFSKKIRGPKIFLDKN